MTLHEALLAIQARPEMYFGPGPGVTDVFTFLMGWDMAMGTEWSRRSIEVVAGLKGTGCRVPGPEDIGFAEALEVILGLVSG
jgi:hypothetical protein